MRKWTSKLTDEWPHLHQKFPRAYNRSFSSRLFVILFLSRSSIILSVFSSDLWSIVVCEYGKPSLAWRLLSQYCRNRDLTTGFSYVFTFSSYYPLSLFWVSLVASSVGCHCEALSQFLKDKAIMSENTWRLWGRLGATDY